LRTVCHTDTYSNGDVYNGEWHDDHKRGQGTYTYACQDRYEGAFLDDTFHGQGVFVYANGEQLVGTWVKDNAHGQMLFTSGDGGERFTDVYEHGERVARTPVTASAAADVADDDDKKGCDA
jgi:hypothetical protein